VALDGGGGPGREGEGKDKTRRISIGRKREEKMCKLCTSSTFSLPGGLKSEGERNPRKAYGKGKVRGLDLSPGISSKRVETGMHVRSGKE